MSRSASLPHTRPGLSLCLSLFLYLVSLALSLSHLAQVSLSLSPSSSLSLSLLLSPFLPHTHTLSHSLSHSSSLSLPLSLCLARSLNSNAPALCSATARYRTLAPHSPPPKVRHPAASGSLALSSLELSDSNNDAPWIRALLGTASHFCEVAALPSTFESNTAQNNSQRTRSIPPHPPVINTLMVRWWVVANMRLLPQKWPAPPWEVAGSFR